MTPQPKRQLELIMLQKAIQTGTVVDILLSTDAVGGRFYGIVDRSGWRMLMLAPVPGGWYVGHHGVLSSSGWDAGGSPVTVAKRNR
jgi:hypothetical protein